MTGVAAMAPIVEMTVEITDMRQLEQVSGSIRRIPGVRDIQRV